MNPFSETQRYVGSMETKHNNIVHKEKESSVSIAQDMNYDQRVATSGKGGGGRRVEA